jgi:SAM-dependent methyltransferase
MDKDSIVWKIGDWIGLVGVNLWVKFRTCREFLAVTWKYYRNFHFARTDLSLLSLYLFKNPYRVAKDYFLVEKGDSDWCYGETPLTTMDQICHKAGWGKNDFILELGCGRGRTSFWMNEFIGCHVVGFDLVPKFIDRANQIRNKFEIHQVEFIRWDISDIDYNTFPSIQGIYFYSTGFESAIFRKLIDRWRTLPSGVIIVTVTSPLSDYTNENLFELVEKFDGEFTWGSGEIFIQRKK